MDRIQKLCSYLDKCSSFADVACDHGYCAEYILKNGLCNNVTVSDVSEKSLSKAQLLLSAYIQEGRCRAVCCDGLEDIDSDTELVMIAGVGGEEIVKILRNSFIPQRFIFQPMKNAKMLRYYLIESGCTISVDDIFTDGKNYYFIIKGSRGGDGQLYSDIQYEYGKDSLLNPVLKEYLNEEIAKKRSYLTRGMKIESRCAIEKNIALIEGVLNGEFK